MGYIWHDAVIVTFDYETLDAAKVGAFRESMPREFRHLLVGPIDSVVNCYVTYVFAPDGSKEGRSDSDLGDELRARFIALFRDDYAADIVEVRFGGDYGLDTGMWTRHGGNG